MYRRINNVKLDSRFGTPALLDFTLKTSVKQIVKYNNKEKLCVCGLFYLKCRKNTIQQCASSISFEF